MEACPVKTGVEEACPIRTGVEEEYLFQQSHAAKLQVNGKNGHRSHGVKF